MHLTPQSILVRKLDPSGTETWRYNGIVLERTPRAVRLEARFNRDDLPFNGVLLRRDDRFVESFYSDRWYNIFEIHDRDTDEVKCWYCNIGHPAEIREDEVSYRDLALDLLVYPDGFQRVLDEDEFEQIPLDPEQRREAQRALTWLQAYFRSIFAQGQPFRFPE